MRDDDRSPWNGSVPARREGRERVPVRARGSAAKARGRVAAAIVAAIVLVGGCALVRPQRAEPPTPDPFLDAALDYLDALNAVAVEPLLAFLESRATSPDGTPEGYAKAADAHLGIARQIAPLVDPTVRSRDDELLVLLARREGTDEWFRWRFSRDAGSERLKSIRVWNSPAPEALDRVYDASNPYALAENVRRDLEVPGLAFAVARLDGTTGSGAAGVKREGHADPVRVDDRFHVGSCTKSMTALLVGTLVDAGAIDWETSIETAVGDGFGILDAYRPIPIERVMHHRARLVGHSVDLAEAIERWGGGPEGSTTERRRDYLRDVLELEPDVAPDTFHYSNAGYALLGYVAERLARTSWETLLEERVFEPLGMDSAGFGWPRADGRSAEPFGHSWIDERWEPFDESVALGPFVAPAGDVHASVLDMARYGLEHVRGRRGESTIATSETFRRLHTPAEDAEAGRPYAAGWRVDGAGDDAVLWHAGSAGPYYFRLIVVPSEGIAIAIGVNAKPHEWRMPLFDKLVDALTRGYGERASADAPG